MVKLNEKKESGLYYRYPLFVKKRNGNKKSGQFMVHGEDGALI